MADHSLDDSPEPRPEPVLDQALIVSSATGLIAAVCTAAVVFGVLPQADATQLTQALVAAVGAVVTLINVALPLWRGRIARGRVTPLAAPVSASGEPLVALAAVPTITAAAAARDIPAEASPEPTPWAEDTNRLEVL